MYFVFNLNIKWEKLQLRQDKYKHAKYSGGQYKKSGICSYIGQATMIN